MKKLDLNKVVLSEFIDLNLLGSLLYIRVNKSRLEITDTKIAVIINVEVENITFDKSYKITQKLNKKSYIDFINGILYSSNKIYNLEDHKGLDTEQVFKDNSNNINEIKFNHNGIKSLNKVKQISKYISINHYNDIAMGLYSDDTKIYFKLDREFKGDWSAYNLHIDTKNIIPHNHYIFNKITYQIHMDNFKSIAMQRIGKDSREYKMPTFNKELAIKIDKSILNEIKGFKKQISWDYSQLNSCVNIHIENNKAYLYIVNKDEFLYYKKELCDINIDNTSFCIHYNTFIDLLNLGDLYINYNSYYNRVNVLINDRDIELYAVLDNIFLGNEYPRENDNINTDDELIDISVSKESWNTFKVQNMYIGDERDEEDNFICNKAIITNDGNSIVIIEKINNIPTPKSFDIPCYMMNSKEFNMKLDIRNKKGYINNCPLDIYTMDRETFKKKLSLIRDKEYKIRLNYNEIKEFKNAFSVAKKRFMCEETGDYTNETKANIEFKNDVIIFRNEEGEEKCRMNFNSGLYFTMETRYTRLNAIFKYLKASKDDSITLEFNVSYIGSIQSYLNDNKNKVICIYANFENTKQDDDNKNLNKQDNNIDTKDNDSDTNDINKDINIENNNNLNIDNAIDIDISIDNNINNINTKDFNVKEYIAKNLLMKRDFKSYFNQMRVKFFNSILWSENIWKKLGSKLELINLNINNRVLAVRLHKDTS